MKDLENSAKEGESPVDEMLTTPRRILSTAEHEKFRRNPRGPSRKAKYSLVTDSEPVPGVKEILKPCAYK